MRVLQCREACLQQTRSTDGGFWNTDQLKEGQPEREEEKTDLQNGLHGGGGGGWQVLRAHRDLCPCNTTPMMILFCHLQLMYVCICTCFCACLWAWAEQSRMCCNVIMKNTTVLNSAELFSKWYILDCVHTIEFSDQQALKSPGLPHAESLLYVRTDKDVASCCLSYCILCVVAAFISAL